MTWQNCQKLSVPSQDLKTAAPEFATTVNPYAGLFDEKKKKSINFSKELLLRRFFLIISL